MVEQFANSGDHDQMPRSAASDLGLHCFPVTRLVVSQDTSPYNEMEFLGKIQFEELQCPSILMYGNAIQLINTYRAMGKFSRRQPDDMFSYFSQKIWSDTSCQLSLCMKCQILFSRENKKNISKNVVCWIFYPACSVRIIVQSKHCIQVIG